MNNFMRYSLLSFATAEGIFIIFAIFFGMHKYDKYICALEKGEFKLQKLFFIGFVVIDLFKLRRNIFIDVIGDDIKFIKNERYYKYYFNMLYAGMIVYSMFALEIGFIISAITGNMEFLFFCVISGLSLSISLCLSIHLEAVREKDEIISDFSKVISKLQIYLTTGMPLRDAWRKVSNSGDSRIFLEMKKTDFYMKNGFTEIEAINKFGENCYIEEVRKFSNVLTQNIEKGNKDIINIVSSMSEEIWNDKVNRIMKKAEIASSKLVFPLMIMLISIMIMIIIPVFSGF